MSVKSYKPKYVNLFNIKKKLWNLKDENYIQNARFFNDGQ